MTQQLEARAFAIWRYAAPLSWDVSYDDIAEATGLTYNQVMHAISAKGWGGKIGQGRNTEKGFRSKARIKSLYHKRMGHRFDENALDVVKLIGE